jgi:hypothetical protein
MPIKKELKKQDSRHYIEAMLHNSVATERKAN